MAHSKSELALPGSCHISVSWFYTKVASRKKHVWPRPTSAKQVGSCNHRQECVTNNGLGPLGVSSVLN